MSAIQNEDSKQEFFIMAQEIKEIRQKAKNYQQMCGKEYVYTPEELEKVKKINGEVLQAMDMYIHDFLHSGNYDSYTNIYNDLHSVCVLQLFERFPDYNGQYKLTTFFMPWFKGAVNAYIGAASGKSRYYNEKSVIVQRVIKRLNAEGINPTVPEIKKALGDSKISEKTIRTVLEMDECGTACSVEALEKAQNNVFESPEDIYIRKENEELVNNILNTLHLYERIAYKLFNDIIDVETGLLKGKPTYQMIGKQESFVNAVKAAGKEKWIKNGHVPTSRVEEVVNTAKKKISMHPLVIKSVDSARQAYAEDISETDEDMLDSMMQLIAEDE